MSAPVPDPLDTLTRILLAEHSLQSVMTAAAEVGKQLVPAADEVSVTLLSGGAPVTVAATGELALQVDERQYADERGPCLTAATSGEVVTVQETSAVADRWPGFARGARDFGVRSSLSVPVPVQPPLQAALNLYSRAPGSFDAAAVAEGERLAEQAAVALTNMHLVEAQAQAADQLRDAMATRSVIEQAKGILMADRRISADDAFSLLVTLSQHSNRKLRDVARALVEDAGSRPA